jgi:hypothetical protein
MEELPPLVARAQSLARRAGFPLSREEAGPGRPSACLPGNVRDEADLDTLAGLLRAGGRIVMDDLTPQRALAPDSPLLANDLKRQFFASPRLISAEVVLPDLQNSLLVGTRTD